MELETLTGGWPGLINEELHFYSHLRGLEHSMKKITAHVIALTKAVHLTKPKDEPGYMAQFLVGTRNRLSFIGGFGLSWWYTKRSFKTIETIASMLIDSKNEFRDGDIDSVQEVIRETLKEVCIDKALFDPDAVCFAYRETLFECKLPIGTDVFGSAILGHIVANLRKTINRRCTIYVAPRLIGQSFEVPQIGVSVIKKTDEAAWRAMLTKGYQTNDWVPFTGSFPHNEGMGFSRLHYDYIFVSEETGTQKGSKFSSQLKLRRLFSVIYAIACEHGAYRLTKSAAAPYTLCLQFPESSAYEVTITMSEIGSLLPYYINDLVLSTEQILQVQGWFDATYRLADDVLSRVEKCAHFINRAMNANDIESYINYYVALDALFGERGAVEASILNGVKDLQLEDSMEAKAGWLFDLRNELVHGGSRFIREWVKYQRYYRHFDSRPEEDIQSLVFAALRQAPAILG